MVALSRFIQFGVRVSIEPGEVVCSTKIARTELTLRHRASEVTMTRAWLMPPALGMRTQLSLIGEAGEHAQLMIWWGARRLAVALEEAGFTVHQRRRWLPPMGNWPPLNTRIRFRRS